MRISAVIPSYNQGRFLAATIESILAQRVRPEEILVLDGGSTDESMDVIRRYEKYLTWWRSQRDGGQAAAVNEGVRRAKGEWICWVNSDDGLAPHALDRLREVVARRAVEVVTGGSFWISEHATAVSYFAPQRNITVDDFRCGSTPLNQPATFFTRKVWERLGGLDESLRYALDYEFFLRVWRANIHYAIVPHALAFNRVHGAMKSKDARLVRELEATARRYFGEDTGPYPSSVMRKYGWRLPLKYDWRFLATIALRPANRRPEPLPGVVCSPRNRGACELLRVVRSAPDQARAVEDAC